MTTITPVKQRGFRGHKGAGVILADGRQWIFPSRARVIRPAKPSHAGWTHQLVEAEHDYSWGPIADLELQRIVSDESTSEHTKLLGCMMLALSLNYTLTYREMSDLLTFDEAGFLAAVESLRCALGGID